MGLFIRDEKVRELAAEVAAVAHCSLTDAVRSALEAELERLRTKRTEKVRRTLLLADEIKKLPELRPGFTDRDLYDDRGAPVL